MTVKMMEGWEIDTASANLAKKYENTANFGTAQTGRLFGTALSGNTTSPGFRFRTPAFGSTGTWIVGFGYLPANTTGTESKILSIQKDGVEQIALYAVVNSGAVQWRVKRGSTTLGTTTNSWVNGFWIYVEFKVLLDTNGSNGEIEVRVNENSELLVTGIDTTDIAETTANQVEFTVLNAGGTPRIDDIYVCDGQGSMNNDFLGDSVVEGMLPSGDGNRTDWTPDAGSINYQRVDEATLDSDSTYVWVANTSDGVVDLYTFPNITTIATNVYAVQVGFALRMDTSGQDKVRVIMRNGGGTEATSATDHTIDQTSGYKWFTEIFEQDLTITGDWTVTNFNAMEFGLESRPV